MSWSLNEIESLAKKAARGAGLSWGLAEEAGKATRWLCAAGLPGVESLAALLTRNDGLAYGALCPTIGDGPWQASGGTLCPLIAGAALSDRAAELANGTEVTLQEVSHPLLLVPFLASAADITGAHLSLQWDGAVVSRGAGGTHIDATPDALSAAQAGPVRVGLARASQGTRINRGYRGDMSAEAATTLEAFARRTYAPDTEESRLAGAGAGLSDND